MMSVLSKALVVSLFVLLSAVLFTALLPLVFNVLISFYSYNLPPPQPPTLSADEVEAQKPDPKIDFQPETPASRAILSSYSIGSVSFHAGPITTRTAIY